MKLWESSNYELSEYVSDSKKWTEESSNKNETLLTRPTYEEFKQKLNVTQEEIDSCWFENSFNTVYSCYDHIDTLNTYKKQLSDLAWKDIDLIKAVWKSHINSIEYIAAMLDMEENQLNENVFVHKLDYSTMDIDYFSWLTENEEMKSEIAYKLSLEYKKLRNEIGTLSLNYLKLKKKMCLETPDED